MPVWSRRARTVAMMVLLALSAGVVGFASVVWVLNGVGSDVRYDSLEEARIARLILPAMIAFGGVVVALAMVIAGLVRPVVASGVAGVAILIAGLAWMVTGGTMSIEVNLYACTGEPRAMEHGIDDSCTPLVARPYSVRLTSGDMELGRAESTIGTLKIDGIPDASYPITIHLQGIDSATAMMMGSVDDGPWRPIATLAPVTQAGQVVWSASWQLERDHRTLVVGVFERDAEPLANTMITSQHQVLDLSAGSATVDENVLVHVDARQHEDISVVAEDDGQTYACDVDVVSQRVHPDG